MTRSDLKRVLKTQFSKFLSKDKVTVLATVCGDNANVIKQSFKNGPEYRQIDFEIKTLNELVY